MAKLSIREGYGKSYIIEVSDFTRILKGEFEDNEEVRIDRPVDWTDGYEYVGVAPAGSSPNDTVWSCLRCKWLNNRKERIQFRSDIAWSNRTQGWN